MLTEQQRTNSIIQHLQVGKPYKNQVSDLIEQIRILGEDLGDAEPEQITKARIYSELAGYFSSLAAKELT